MRSTSRAALLPLLVVVCSAAASEPRSPSPAPSGPSLPPESVGRAPAGGPPAGRVELLPGSPGAAGAAATAGNSGGGIAYRPRPSDPPVILRRTAARVGTPELATYGGMRILIASWDEGDESSASPGNDSGAEGAPGRASRWQSVSRDGGASWSRSRPISFDVHLKAGRFRPGSRSPAAPRGLEARAGGRLWIVQFETVSLQAFRDRLENLGAELLRPLPSHAHIVQMDAAVAGSVALEPFVRWVGRYHPAWRVEPASLSRITSGSVATDTPRRWHVQTFDDDPNRKELLAADIRAAGGRILRRIRNGTRIQAELTGADVLRLLHSDRVLWVEPWTPFETDMDLVRIDSGANDIEGIAGYDGSGVRGEVMDDGLMGNPIHQDHDNVLYHGPIPSGADHGTATYGIVFSNGNRDGDGDAQATGMLPAAQGYFSDFDLLIDRYLHTAELVSSPIFASFQSNSWGSGRTTAYTTDSFQMDDIIWQSDIPILQSQSNAGTTESRPEAWAKNVISIGGVKHQDTVTRSDDCWCNGASIGPAFDGRLKPDLVHFYDSVFTTDREPGGFASGNNYYTSFGGTSAATPIVAGLTGLLLEMWADDVWGTAPGAGTVFDKRPHASTTKALLINTAAQYPFTGPADDMARTHQGWGLPDLKRAYDRAPMTWVVDEDSPITELEIDVYTAVVPAGQAELAITMVYTDLAGTTSASQHRINDVTLKVTAPDGTIYWGNNGLDSGVWSAPGGVPDSLNTVENVFVQTPLAGSWNIEITADEVIQDAHIETPFPDQDYALVVYGASSFESCRDQADIPATVSAVPRAFDVLSDSAIDIGWSATAASDGYEVFRSNNACLGPFQRIRTVGPGLTQVLDRGLSGGSTYGYIVRASEGGCVSRNSVCTEAVADGPCHLPPSFAGAQFASSEDASTCGVTVTWGAAAAACGGGARFDVYRSLDPTFLPGPDNRVASCIDGQSFVDTSTLDHGRRYHYIVRARDTASRPVDPCGGVDDGNLAAVIGIPLGVATTLRSDTFEAGPNGWLVDIGSPPAATGDFITGDPFGTFSGSDPAQPDAAASGVACLYTAENPIGAIGTDDVDLGEVSIVSPTFDASGYESARLRLKRWHYNRDIGEDSGDYFAIDLSSINGNMWTNLETLDHRVNANSWTERTIQLEEHLPLSTLMRLRLRAADGPNEGNIIESAVDDVLVEGMDACQRRSGPPGTLMGFPALIAEEIQGFVKLIWGPDCGGSSGFTVYRGDLQSGYGSIAPAPGMCNVTARNATLDAGPGDVFFLIAPSDGSFEGSLGVDGAGLPRPPAAAACHPRAAGACAP